MAWQCKQRHRQVLASEDLGMAGGKALWLLEGILRRLFPTPTTAAPPARIVEVMHRIATNPMPWPCPRPPLPSQGRGWYTPRTREVAKSYGCSLLEGIRRLLSCTPSMAVLSAPRAVLASSW